MKRTTRSLVAALACLGTLAGSGAAVAQAKTVDILLAGDSYTSGVGAGSITGSNTKCYRSAQAWGQLYAAQLRRNHGDTVNVSNVACAGGVVKDLDGQIAQITPDTDLVALTVGGNDVGFANIVVSCFAPVISDPARCKSAIDSGKAQVPSVVTGALKRIEAAHAKLHPGAKIIVISYPYLANPRNYILRGLFNSYNAGAAVRQLGDLGDQAVIDAAAQANAEFGDGFVTFVPTKDLFVGHEPNQDPYVDNPSGWIWEFSGLKNPLDIYHPKPAGQLAISSAILRIAGPDGDFGVGE